MDLNKQALIAKFVALDVSMATFADTHTIPRSVVQKMLNPKHHSNPTLETVTRFAEALKCDPFELLRK